MTRNFQCVWSKLLAGIIYFSFFLVQFDIHPGGAPQDISYFSCDYSTIAQYQAMKPLRSFDVCKKARPVHFRLNKRFHPEKFFEAYFPDESIRLISTVREEIPVMPEEPRVKNQANSISRRGPPALV